MSAKKFVKIHYLHVYINLRNNYKYEEICNIYEETFFF